MKHRSHIAFVLLAAALFAAPQITRDLLSMKSTLGQRVRGEIVRAFLSLNESDGAEPSRTSPLLASFVREKDDAQQQQQASKSQKGDCHSTPTQQRDAPAQASTDGQAQPSTREQTAMLVDPSSVILSAKAESRRALKAAGLPRQSGDASELAMLVPPDAVINLPSLAGESAQAWRESKAAEQFKKAAESQARAAFITTRFERPQTLKVEDAVLLQRVGSILRESDFVHAAGGEIKVRVRMNKRSTKAGADSPAVSPRVPVAAFSPACIACLFAPLPSEGE